MAAGSVRLPSPFQPYWFLVTPLQSAPVLPAVIYCGRSLIDTLAQQLLLTP